MKLRLLLFIALFSVASTAFAESAPCLSLGVDLYPGDSNTSVKFLQNFLTQRGYLSAIPNGHYGPATAAAVRTFQLANKISPTGNVGPLTRHAIENTGCATVPNLPTPSPVISGNSGVPSSPSPTPRPLAVTSPATGDILTVGKTYTINWNVPINYFYDITVDRSDGSSGGFILHNGNGGNSFTWKAGKSFSSLGDQTMASGTYRIHIQPVSGVTSNNDPVSGWFTLVGAPIAVTSMNPSSIPADGESVVVLFGSGFDSTSLVRLDSEFGAQANRLYFSPDGSVIVFNIPTNTSSGRHQLYVNNQSQSPQNVGSIIVTK